MTQLACNPPIKMMIDDTQETRVLVESLLKTKHYQRLGPEGIFAIIQKAKATNINPLDALNGGMYYVQGKVEMSALGKKNQAMLRGKTLEETARRAFEKETGLIVFPRVAKSGDHEWMIASLDGVDLEEKVIVEIKCAGEADHAQAKQGKVPEKYYPQLQHQLAVTGLEKNYYYSFDGNEGVIVEVARDSQYIEKLIVEEKKFMECVLTQSPPTLSAKDYCFRDDSDWNERAKKWLQKKKELESIEQEEKKLRDELIELANHQNTQGSGIRLTLSMRKGTIDYRSIPCLKEVDLEQYRKPSSWVWSLSLA